MTERIPNGANMNDTDLIAAINAYMATHKNVTRGELKRKLCTSLYRLENLSAAGLVVIPPKLSKSSGATLGRKKSNVMANWYINRPAPWQSGGA